MVRIERDCQNSEGKKLLEDCQTSEMDSQGRNIGQGIGKESQRSEMDYYQARTIDCRRSEYKGTKSDYPRRNMDLSGRNMEPHSKKINFSRRSIDHQPRNMDCKVNEENIYSEPVFDDDSTYEDHRMPDHGDQSLSNQKLNDKSRMKVLCDPCRQE